MSDVKSELRACKAELDDTRLKVSRQVSTHATELQVRDRFPL
jgi:hypothetical protein